MPILPLMMAGAGLAAAGTAGNRFFQDYANERQQARQGEIMGGILDQSMTGGSVNNDIFAQNLMRGGFMDQGFGIFGNEQTNDHRLGQMSVQNGYDLGQIGARSAASMQLENLRNQNDLNRMEYAQQNAIELAQMQNELDAAEQNPGTFPITAAQRFEYGNEIQTQNARLNQGAQLDHLVTMLGEGADVTGDRTGQMKTLALSVIPIMQDMLNSGTLNEGESEFFQELTGSVEGFTAAFKPGPVAEAQIATIRGIIEKNQAKIDSWNATTGAFLVNAIGPSGNRLPTAQATWVPQPMLDAMTPEGVPLTTNDPTTSVGSFGRRNNR